MTPRALGWAAVVVVLALAFVARLWLLAALIGGIVLLYPLIGSAGTARTHAGASRRAAMAARSTAWAQMVPAARSVRFGVLAAVVLTTFYIAVVAGASGSLQHLVDQARTDWYLLTPILAGFGTQVALVTELRRRHRMHSTEIAAGAAGTSGSTVGMVACCAHHIADLAPFIGATGATVFLLDYRLAFMVAGIGVNAAGVTVAARRLHRTPLPGPRKEAPACHAA